MYSKSDDVSREDKVIPPSSNSVVKEKLIIKDRINEKEVTGEKVNVPIPSANKLNPLSSLSKLNLGTNSTPFSIQPIPKGTGFSLNDLAQAHIKRASVGEANPTKSTNGVPFQLDFNKLNIGERNSATDYTAPSAKELDNKITPVTLSYTSSVTPSLSSLAKQHENVIDRSVDSSKSLFTVSTSTGFKIPSLFGQQNQLPDTSTKKNISTPNPLSGAQIDLSAALLLKDRQIKQQLPENDSTILKLSELSKGRNATADQLLASIDILLSTDSSSDYSNIKNQKRKPSPFGHVLCRKWKQNHTSTLSGSLFKDLCSISPIKNYPTKSPSRSKSIKPFRFDAPSPDDVIAAAQSKVFGRR